MHLVKLLTRFFWQCYQSWSYYAFPVKDQLSDSASNGLRNCRICRLNRLSSVLFATSKDVTIGPVALLHANDTRPRSQIKIRQPRSTSSSLLSWSRVVRKTTITTAAPRPPHPPAFHCVLTPHPDLQTLSIPHSFTFSSPSIDNWQSALRRQYFKRLPEANPLGPEPPVVHSDVDDNEQDPDDTRDDAALPSSDSPEHPPDVPTDPPQTEDVKPEPLDDVDPSPSVRAHSTPIPEPAKPLHKRKPKKKGKAASRAQSRSAANEDVALQFEGETRDWFELSLSEKLDSLYLLTEWQFQNPHRLRQLMKDDDELAQWVRLRRLIFVSSITSSTFSTIQRIEPIGYDAKTNAYWLIGRMYILHRSCLSYEI